MHFGLPPICFAVLALSSCCLAETFKPEIPKAWDDEGVAGLVYRAYPAYPNGHEPKGYLDGLKDREPEIILDPSKVHTKEDWIAAAKLVFESKTARLKAEYVPKGFMSDRDRFGVIRLG